MTTQQIDPKISAAELADHVHALVFCIGRDGDINFANRAACARLGVSAEELRGRRILDLVTPAQRPRTERRLRAVFDSEDAGPVHTQLVTRDGSVVDVEGSLSRAEFDSDPLAAIGFFVERPVVAKAPFTVPVGRQITLTARQQAVLQLFASGHTTKQVAAELDIAVKTVHNHLTTIYRLLDAQSLVQATMIAAQLGLVELAAPMH